MRSLIKTQIVPIHAPKLAYYKNRNQYISNMLNGMQEVKFDKEVYHFCWQKNKLLFITKRRKQAKIAEVKLLAVGEPWDISTSKVSEISRITIS